jgi:hypothetical protein
MHSRYFILLVVFFLLRSFAIQAQDSVQLKNGFCFLGRQDSGKIFYERLRYECSSALYPQTLIDSAFTSFTQNGYPALIICFKKDSASAMFHNSSGKILGWFYKDSMIVCAKVMEMDTSYRLQLTGNYTVQEVKALEKIALLMAGKKVEETESEAGAELISTKQISQRITEKLRLQCDTMTRLFVRALQKHKYQLLHKYMVDSLTKEVFFKKLSVVPIKQNVIQSLEKLDKRPRIYFEKLLAEENIFWQDWSYLSIEFQALTYYPQFDIYVADIIVNLSRRLDKKRIKFDECFYFNNQWWLFCEDITSFPSLPSE